MRLARGSGLDGLAGIRPVQLYGRLSVMRPLLSVDPARLRAYCLAEAQIWVNDPSNHDRRFERVRIRQEAAAMAGAGLDPQRLHRLAKVFGRLRDWSEKRLVAFLMAFGDLDPRGFASLDLSAVLGLPLPLRKKLLSGLLQSIGGLDYPPRLGRMQRLFEWLDDGSRGRITLGGCLIWRGRNERLWIAREAPQAVGPKIVYGNHLYRWDGRFDVTWSGSQPVWIHMLKRCGARRLRLAGAVAKEGQTLPASIRASLPAVTDLDGRLFAPHVFETPNSERPLEGGQFRIEFRPAVPWVADALRASRDDRAVLTD
jgi:tRNA(Ile)-lysidine synthase